jgi:hypothetical protein
MNIHDTPLTFASPQDVEIAQHPGGGLVITITDAKGDTHTVDCYPTILAADESQQWLLDSIAPQLAVKIEHSMSTPERTPQTLSDITDPVDNLILPVIVWKEKA